MININIRRQPYYYAYSTYLARYLIKAGFRCEEVRPNPRKPWLDMYVFIASPELLQNVNAYLEEKQNATE